MKTNVLIPGLALAIGLGVGFGVGKSGGDPATADGLEALNARTGPGARPGMDRAGEQPGRDKKARTLDEIYNKPGQSNRIQALLDRYASLGPDEFAGEAEKLDALPFNERILASVLLFGKWAEVDPTAAMAFTDTMGFAGAFVKPTVLQGWASTDPVNAAKYYTDNPSQFAMMNMMGGRGGRGGMGAQGPGEIIAGEWAKQDPSAAMAWASGLKNNSGQAMTAVISQVAKTDPTKAAQMVGGMPADEQTAAYENIAKQWGAKDFSEARAWANGLPEEQRAAAMSAAIAGLAQGSPELAAAEIGKMTDADAIRDAVPTVAMNYARSDVRGSMDWLNSLDNDDAKRDSMRQVMPIWAAADSAAAMDFIKGQTSPEVKDRAAETYVWSNRNSPPSELAEVAGMITDEGDRNRATGIVAARWMQEDKAAATQYINGNTAIPDEMKERLLSGQPMWGGGDRAGRGRGGD
ncbi:hypothetical protein HZ994_05105 [Akkermansiaceae bacterium]|nr:hypothetical protein HZ994_05105 [Akkermansiaceae bacterium]